MQMSALKQSCRQIKRTVQPTNARANKIFDQNIGTSQAFHTTAKDPIKRKDFTGAAAASENAARKSILPGIK